MLILAQAAKNIFHAHNGVVHQFADGHGQTAQRHRVDRHPEPFEHQARDHYRKRNGRQRDERRAEVQQEQEKDNDHKNPPVAQCVDHVVDAQFDKRLLLVNFRVDADVGRQTGLQSLQGGGDLVGQQPRVRPRLFGNSEHHRRRAVDGRIAAPDLRRFHHPGHLPEKYRPLAIRLHYHVLDILDALQPANASAPCTRARRCSNNRPWRCRCLPPSPVRHRADSLRSSAMNWD